MSNTLTEIALLIHCKKNWRGFVPFLRFRIMKLPSKKRNFYRYVQTKVLLRSAWLEEYGSLKTSSSDVSFVPRRIKILWGLIEHCFLLSLFLPGLLLMSGCLTDRWDQLRLSSIKRQSYRKALPRSYASLGWDWVRTAAGISFSTSSTFALRLTRGLCITRSFWVRHWKCPPARIASAGGRWWRLQSQFLFSPL